jgi:hypothetical protein
VSRLERRLGPPAERPRGLRLAGAGRSPRRALFISPNGIGMGHVTRLLAVARRCEAALEPVFLSMSQAVGVVERMGFLAEYFPYHAYTGEPAEAWNAALKARLDEAIAFYDPRVVVFDGNVPYQGLIEARASHPNRPFAWIRRPCGGPSTGGPRSSAPATSTSWSSRASSPRRSTRGPTAGRGEEAARVPPLSSSARRGAAARGGPRGAGPRSRPLGRARPARLAQQLRLRAIDQAILDELGRRPDVELVFVDWLIGERRQDLPPTCGG